MNDLLLSLAANVKPYLSQVSLAFIATVLVIYGGKINAAIRRGVSDLNFILRTGVFIFVCAFGYGWLTVWLASYLTEQLYKIPSLYLVPSIVVSFFALGAIAQRDRQI